MRSSNESDSKRLRSEGPLRYANKQRRRARNATALSSSHHPETTTDVPNDSTNVTSTDSNPTHPPEIVQELDSNRADLTPSTAHKDGERRKRDGPLLESPRTQSPRTQSPRIQSRRTLETQQAATIAPSAEAEEKVIAEADQEALQIPEVESAAITYEARPPTSAQDESVALYIPEESPIEPNGENDNPLNWPCFIPTMLFKISAFFGKNTILYLTLCKKSGIDPKDFFNAQPAVQKEISLYMAITTSSWASIRFFDKDSPSSTSAKWFRYILFLAGQGISSSILYSAVMDHRYDTTIATGIVALSTISSCIADLSKMPDRCLPKKVSNISNIFPCLGPIAKDTTHRNYPVTKFFLFTGGGLDFILFSYQMIPNIILKLSSSSEVTFSSAVIAGSCLMTNVVYFQYSYLSLMSKESALFYAPASSKVAIGLINAGIGLGGFFLGRFILASAGVQGELSDFSAIWNAFCGGFIAGSFHMANNLIEESLPENRISLLNPEGSTPNESKSIFSFFKSIVCCGSRRKQEIPPSYDALSSPLTDS